MQKHRPKVLVIDNYDSFTYNLIQMLEEDAGCSFDIVRNDQLGTYAGSEYKKILISPGPGLPAESGSICEFIRKNAASSSILGICLGHQAIAEVFGGRVFQLASVAHGVQKRIRLCEPKDYLFAGVPDYFPAGLYHSWAVEEETLPECLHSTALSDDGILMALAHRRYDVRGIQFHPESILTEIGKTIVHNWITHESNV